MYWNVYSMCRHVKHAVIPRNRSNMSNVSNMFNMYYMCRYMYWNVYSMYRHVTHVEISWNMSNVSNMSNISYMCYMCRYVVNMCQVCTQYVPIWGICTNTTEIRSLRFGDVYLQLKYTISLSDHWADLVRPLLDTDNWTLQTILCEFNQSTLLGGYMVHDWLAWVFI